MYFLLASTLQLCSCQKDANKKFDSEIGVTVVCVVVLGVRMVCGGGGVGCMCLPSPLFQSNMFKPKDSRLVVSTLDVRHTERSVSWSLPDNMEM